MNNKKFTLFACAFISLFLMNVKVHAQNNWYNKPVKSITFEGLNNIKASDLDGIVAGFIGRVFDDDMPNEIYDKLDALEYFSDINLKLQKVTDSDKSIKIIIEVKEYPVVAKIIFSGNKQLHDSELKDAISLKDKEIFNKNTLLNDERKIRNHYIDKGYSEIQVSSSTEIKNDRVYVTFNISEGKQTVVKKIVFEGNKIISSKTLKSKISLKEAGLFNNGAFQDVSLSTDAKTIIFYYQSRGYIDAKVLNVKTDSQFNEEKKRQELTIIFELQEGTQYNFGGITFEGNSVFSSEKLSEYIKLKVGSIYNETKFQESKAAIQNLYYENGYTSNYFDVQMNKDIENKTVSYVFKIMENARSHIENIIVKGNTRTKDFVILREIPLETGDIFSNTKIMNGMRNLYNLQYFSAVVPEVLPGSEENLINLVFSVEEQSTTTLDFGLTFSGVTDPDAVPVSLMGKVNFANLFGEGKSLQLGTTISTDEQSANVSYGQNWIFDLPIATSVSLSYSHSKKYSLINMFLPDGSIDDDYYYMQYDQHELNSSFSLGRRWTPDFAILSLYGGISFSLINNVYNNELYVPYDASISLYNNNFQPKNSIWSSFSMDGRDVNFDPSKGFFFSERIAWYGLLPQSVSPTFYENEFYPRFDTKAELYFTLFDIPVSESWNFKLVLMGYSNFSFQIPCFNSTIKPSNQLYIDGMFNGRGWNVYNADIGRGNLMWNNSVELRMPVVAGVFSFDLWFDAAVIKDNARDLFTDINESDWFFSFGPSIRLTISQFPLRFLFSNRFKIENGQVVFKNQTCTGNSEHWYPDFTLSFNLINR